MDDKMVWPVQHVPREKLPDDLAQAKREEALSKKEDNETENEDVTPLGDITPEQLEVEFDPTGRLERCIQQRMGQQGDHSHHEGDPCSKDCCKGTRRKGAEHWGGCGKTNAAPPPQENKDVITVIESPTGDIYDAYGDQSATPGTDDYDSSKIRG